MSYWKKREEEAKKHYLTEEAEIQKSLERKYNLLLTDIEKEIYGFYTKYARDEGLTMAEARKAVDKMDVQAFADKARRYVKTRDFSAKANAELKLYNATMKINRLELLKANIGLELIDAFNEIDAELRDAFENRAMEEFNRQAGILGDSVKRSAKNAKSIVNASFHHATFSERIWMYQAQLKHALDDLLTNSIVQGYNPRVLARDLIKAFGASRANAERLMRTEMARVQTEAQKQSFDTNGFDQYMFLALGNACDICKAIDGEVFNVKDMMPGENAPPMHPNCRCSTAAYMDRAAVDRELSRNENQHNTELRQLNNPLTRDRIFSKAYFKTGKLSQEEYVLAKSLWHEYKEIEISASEKAHVIEELDNNLTAEEKSSAIVSRPIGNYRYTAINLGHATYKIINKEIIEGVSTSDTIIDEVLDEIFGKEWRTW